MTLFIGGTTSDAITNAHKAATSGEAATQPVNPDLVVTEKGEPEVATENPEFTGGVNGVEPAINEVPEYTGGANAVEADKNTQEEYKGGVNGVEPAVHEVPDYTGGVNDSEPAVADPKGEATVPAEAPKTDSVAPVANDVTTNNVSNVPVTEPTAEGKPEQPSGDKPEEPGKPVEAKTGHDSPSNVSPLVGVGFGALIGGAVAVRRRARIED